ncbi:hypothetical protein PF008_g28667 [Phytophthora fragariae]|uniref:EF-hand domain-containing protein n=4 Tax=Phytophthora fragariae TaxID=53985 RepID=A0A6G0QAN3_9STRA|nr:hypothetical protein PF003_g8670 [Phytophthora fragariae]KAE9278210.1 hypothetical protein PF008_g28667 [Phytophthora fragariae]
MLTEVGGIDGYSGTMLAFQVADLIIFILAISLVLQALWVLVLLRGGNKRADRAELITTQDLVDVLNSSDKGKPSDDLFNDEIVRHRLLRNLFLRRFGLPQLFPFSKYVRRAQANNIVHMIEVEPSMWLLLLGMAWAFSAVVRILEDFEVDMRYELIEALLAFAWVLVLLHVLVLQYFRRCVRRLLAIAGYSKDKRVLAQNLSAVAEEEARAWQNEAADSALEAMNQIHTDHEEMEHERKAARRGVLKSDAGIQLVASCFRNVSRMFCCQKRLPRPSGVQPGSPTVTLRFFSRKIWHVVVMFMTILNGFLIALLVQGAVYSFDEIYDQVGLVPVVLIPLPLLLNGLLLQKSIFRDFVLISSAIRIDASTLGEVVHHFREIVELRAEFATSLMLCLKEKGSTIADLEKTLQSYDLVMTGFVDIDKLRSVLASFGFHLTRFRFNSVVKLLFELQGTKVEYAQLIQLVTLIQQEQCLEDGQASQRFQYPILQRTVTSFEDAGTSSLHLPLLAQSSLAPEPAPSDFTSSPSFRRLETAGSSADGTNSRRLILERSLSRQFTRSSSRMLHGVYNLRPASTDLTSDSAYSLQR